MRPSKRTVSSYIDYRVFSPFCSFVGLLLLALLSACASVLAHTAYICTLFFFWAPVHSWAANPLPVKKLRIFPSLRSEILEKSARAFLHFKYGESLFIESSAVIGTVFVSVFWCFSVLSKGPRAFLQIHSVIWTDFKFIQTYALRCHTLHNIFLNQVCVSVRLIVFKLILVIHSSLQSYLFAPACLVSVIINEKIVGLFSIFIFLLLRFIPNILYLLFHAYWSIC